MMGTSDPQPSLFYHINLEPRVTADHPMRKIRPLIDTDRIRQVYEPLYADRPYPFWDASDELSLIGYCHVRSEPRMAAVGHIKSVRPTDFPYQSPLHFNFEAFVEDSFTVMRERRIEVE